MDGVVDVRGGRVRGVRRHDLWSFSGIPYAGSPAGGRRWRPPAEPEPWTGIRECDRFTPIAPQSPGLVEMSLGGEPEEHDRGLPQPQRLDAGPRRQPAPGDGVDPRRFVRERIGSRQPLPGRHAGPGGGRGGGDHQLPPGPAGVPRPSRAGGRRPELAGRGAVVGVRQLGPGRSGGGTAVGARPHRRLRGRPRQRHRVRRVRRRHERVGPAGRAGRPRTVPPGHRGERAAVHLHRRAGRHPGRGGRRPPRDPHDPPGRSSRCRPTPWCGRRASSARSAPTTTTPGC